MTEIVDERQRLVARLRQWARVGTEYVTLTAKEAADLIEQDGKRLSRARDALIAARDTAPGQTWTLAFVEEMNAVIDALASPSEGNKKEVALWQACVGAASYLRGSDPTVADVKFALKLLEDARASRPQEQPRTATGEEVEEAYNAARDKFLHENDGAQFVNHAAHVEGLHAALALSISPAAAQRWQTTGDGDD